jgi:hypothetical protein
MQHCLHPQGDVKRRFTGGSGNDYMRMALQKRYTECTVKLPDTRGHVQLHGIQSLARE